MEFEEKQQLKLWWLYVLLGIETILVIGIVLFDKGGMSFQDLKNNHFLPIFSVIIPLVIIYLISRNYLVLKINVSGISYRYWPFTENKSISWTQIDRLYVRKYNALREYGGWGVRHHLWFKFNDKAYIFNDKIWGLQAVLYNDKKILFSTAKSNELIQFLINLKNQYNIEAIETDVRER